MSEQRPEARAAKGRRVAYSSSLLLDSGDVTPRAQVTAFEEELFKSRRIPARTEDFVKVRRRAAAPPASTPRDSDFSFTHRTAAMLLVCIHQFDLALQLLIQEPLVLEVELDFLFARVFTDVAFV